MANTAWGIDIGNRALKAVKLSRGPTGVVVEDFAFIEHETILSEAGDNRDQLVETALARFVARHETKKVECNVGVSGQQSFARFVKLPPVEPKKVPEIVKFEAVQQIPFPLDEVEWSYQLFETADDPDVEVGIFAMRKELVNDFVTNFVAVDLDVAAVQTVPLATYNALRYDGRLDKGHSVILDLGANSCEMTIADNDSIWMRSLDIGGNTFTEALAKAFKIDFDKAEEMKRGAKQSKYAKQIYQAMRPVFGDLVSEVQRSIGYYSSSHRDTKLRKIICTGGGFKLNGLSGYLQKNLQMTVEKPQKFRSPAPEEADAAAAMSEHALSGMGAYGLALQLLGEAKVSSSLLPTNIKVDKMWRDKTKWFMVAGGLCAAALGIAAAGVFLKSTAFERGGPARSELSTIQSEAQSLDQRWSSVTSDGSAELRQVQNVNVLVSDRDYWGQLLVDITNNLPTPPENVARALAGQLGDPAVYDDADKAAVEAVPLEDRAWVQLQSLESVYTDNLGEIVNSVNALTTAEDIFSKANFTEFEGVWATNAPTLVPEENRIIKTDTARGYVMRAILITPLSRDQAFARFDYTGTQPIPKTLEQMIAPSASNPNLPYRVALADIRSFDELYNSGVQLDRLRAMFEAKQAVQGAEEEEAATGNARINRTNRTNRGNRTPPAGGNPYGGTSGDPYGNPYGNPYGQGGNPGGVRGGGGRPTGGGGGVDPNSDEAAFIDPVTGESMLNYTVIELVFAVQLDPPVYDPTVTTPDTQGGDDEGGDDYADEDEGMAALD